MSLKYEPAAEPLHIYVHRSFVPPKLSVRPLWDLALLSWRVMNKKNTGPEPSLAASGVGAGSLALLGSTASDWVSFVSKHAHLG